MQIPTATGLKKLGPKQIEAQLGSCPPLPSLGSINKELQELIQAEQRYSTQISEIIRRDPSLTARLLRVVNSVYYGLSSPVSNVEEAVFYLGLRQIRQMAMVTPIIEDFQRLTERCPFPWRDFWQHCIGTAMLTREIVALTQVPTEEDDYVAGLVHDVGKIAMAWTFPEHFAEIHQQALTAQRDLVEIENEILGMDHAEIGAIYLQQKGLPEIMVESARYHHHPERAQRHQQVIAAVQVADLLMRNACFGCSGNYLPVTREQCASASGWSLLAPKPGRGVSVLSPAMLERTMERLPGLLEGLV